MVSDAAIVRLSQALAETAILKAELKRRSMIYQYEEKCRVAAFFGMTFEQVNLPFAEWSELRDRYHRQLETMTTQGD